MLSSKYFISCLGSTVCLNQSEAVKRMTTNYDHILVPMDIPELAASVFLSNFVWPLEGVAIKSLKVGILN